MLKSSKHAISYEEMNGLEDNTHNDKQHMIAIGYPLTTDPEATTTILQPTIDYQCITFPTIQEIAVSITYENHTIVININILFHRDNNDLLDVYPGTYWSRIKGCKIKFIGT